MLPRELTCKELVEVVTDYLEGRLSPDERQRFEEHLAACLGCKNYLGQIETTIRLVGRLGEEHIPPRARDELLAAFRGWKRA